MLRCSVYLDQTQKQLLPHFPTKTPYPLTWNRRRAKCVSFFSWCYFSSESSSFESAGMRFSKSSFTATPLPKLPRFLFSPFVLSQPRFFSSTGANTTVDSSSQTKSLWDATGELQTVLQQRRVVIDEGSASSIRSRHIEPPSPPKQVAGKKYIPLIVPDRVDATLYSSWPSGKVFTVSGSSGSGKTVHAVLASKKISGGEEKDPVVIYLTSDSFPTWSEDEKQANIAEREHLVCEAVKRAIVKLLRSQNIHFDRSPSASFRVVVVFDDMGVLPKFVRVLRFVARHLALELHRLFFHDSTLHNPVGSSSSNISGDQDAMAKSLLRRSDQTFSERCMVHFIVAGTSSLIDSSVGGRKVGSSETLYTAVVLDNIPLSFASIVNPYFMKIDSDSYVKQRLLRLADIIQLQQKKETQRQERYYYKQTHHPTKSDFIVPTPSSTELIMTCLVKNARCAAILCNELLKNKIAGRFECCGQVFDQVLTGLLPVVISEYVQRTALHRFLRPENTLLCALAAHAFYLHDLPRGKLSQYPELELMLEGRFDSSRNQRYCFESVSDALSMQGGVLGDGALEFDPRTTTPYFPFSTKRYSSASSATKFATTLFLPASGRYHFSEPHRAMLYSLMGITRRPQAFTGFEESIADCCALLAAASPFHRALLAGLPPRSIRARKRWLDFVRKNADPLIDFKLAFDFPDAELSSKDRKLGVSYYQNRMMFKFDDKHSEDMKVVLDAFLANVSSGEAVAVFLSAPLEPFADVVVVGPNKLILIQCKSGSAAEIARQQVDVPMELAKMGLSPIQDVEGKHSDSQNPTAFPGSIKCLAELVKRCKVAGSDTPVVIEAFIITAFIGVEARGGSTSSSSSTLSSRSTCHHADKMYGVDLINRIGGLPVECRARVIEFQRDAVQFRYQCLFPAFPNDFALSVEVEAPSAQ